MNIAYRVGPIIELIMNGTHDVLGFDPRGINMTLPRVRCMDSLVTRAKLQDILGSTAPNLNIHDVGIWDVSLSSAQAQVHTLKLFVELWPAHRRGM